VPVPSHKTSPDLVERTRRRMVELSIPAGADTAILVERISGEMTLNAELVRALKRYGRHGAGCSVYSVRHGAMGCDCGWAGVEQGLKENGHG
jgi:hypothetical protein